MTQGPEHASAPLLSRRRALQQAGVLAGAVVFAAPTVQRLALRPAAAVSPPPPPPPPPEDGGKEISYVGLVFTCEGTTYRAKWEDGGFTDVTSVGQWDSLPQCPPPAGWTTATGLAGGTVPNKGPIAVTPAYNSKGELVEITFALPDGCQFQDASGVAKGGAGTEGPGATNGYCVSGTSTGQTITFTAPA